MMPRRYRKRSVLDVPTLGWFIEELSQYDPKSEVQYAFGYMSPTTFDSYRGYYEDLALGYKDNADYSTVKQILEQAVCAIDTTFHGWKGGDFVMTRNSRLWIANRGFAGGISIRKIYANSRDYELPTVIIDTTMMDA